MQNNIYPIFKYTNKKNTNKIYTVSRYRKNKILNPKIIRKNAGFVIVNQTKKKFVLNVDIINIKKIEFLNSTRIHNNLIHLLAYIK